MNRQDYYWERAHARARDHLLACEVDPEEVEDYPAAAPYCGCEVCVVREVLYGAYDDLDHHFRHKHATNVVIIASVAAALGALFVANASILFS